MRLNGTVARIVALALLVLALPLAAKAQPEPFNVSIRPLSDSQKERLRGRFWRAGCPVSLSQLRVLTVLHVGFDGRVRSGQLVVNADVAAPLAKVFRRLYELRFPIRHMRFADAYGPAHARPRDGDISGSFECRQAVPSPCTGGSGTGTWSNHAYGYAVDLNPVENPYVGCGQSRDPKAQSFRDRSRHRPGMVTPRVIKAFASIGWGWGGSWSGNTKDYMHFSTTGH
jgi:D-alanyl-D-alanine carboxypeptidase